MTDLSNGYESVAADFIKNRTAIGSSTVSQWASRVPAGGTMLDIGCGTGFPITQALVEAGLNVFGIDAAPAMIAEFRRNLPGVTVECCSAEESNFFERQFDGIVAWGLIFLLSPESQQQLISKAAQALHPAGELLFTAPRMMCSWKDSLTGLQSRSLGIDLYERFLRENDLDLIDTYTDEGKNHYFIAKRTSY